MDDKVASTIVGHIAFGSQCLIAIHVLVAPSVIDSTYQCRRHQGELA